jgi:hypothetical protein
VNRWFSPPEAVKAVATYVPQCRHGLIINIRSFLMSIDRGREDFDVAFRPSEANYFGGLDTTGFTPVEIQIQPTPAFLETFRARRSRAQVSRGR